MRAKAAHIEIVERVHSPNAATDWAPIKPTEVRINGHPILIPKDEPIIVHEITANNPAMVDECVSVTLTLWAKTVTITEETVDEVQEADERVAAAQVEVEAAQRALVEAREKAVKV